MNNLEFLNVIKKSFITCLKTSERSTEKLKILHGAIAQDMFDRLNQEENVYNIISQGFGNGKESKILGRYVNKAVDITIKNNQNDRAVAGIAVKFVMSNYSQNSNNYFENMLGETANIRSAKVPYFQIFVIPDVIPYYKKNGDLSRWEEISEHYLNKYIKLSEDNINNYMHTPNKTLVFIIHINKNLEQSLTTKDEFKSYFINNDFSLSLSNLNFNFEDNIIYNNYEEFAKKITYSILSI